MQLEIKHIQEATNITTVYVTHDQEEALTMSDRIAVMRDGRIEQVGSPRDLYERPASAFVAGFLGDSNFLEGRVDTVDGASVLITREGFRVRLPSGAELQPGEQIGVALRPERIRVGTPDGKDTVLQGILDEVIYVGDSSKLRVRVADGCYLVAKEQNQDGTRHWRRGESVHLAWNSTDVVIVSRNGQQVS